MTLGTTPLSTTPLGANQFPVSAVQEPGQTNLTALEGGAGSVDGNGNRTAPANVYVKNANANGQNVMANSASIAIASDQVVPVQAAFKELASLSAGSLNADLVPSTDVSAYRWWSLQIGGTWSGRLTFQCSNDNVGWITTIGGSLQSQSTTAGSTTGTGDIFGGPVYFRYFRVRMTTYTSGSATGTLELYTTATQMVMGGALVTQTVAIAGGSIPFHLISGASTNGTVVKASVGQIYGYDISNTAGSARYVHIYNKGTTPTVGTDVPIRTLQIPANGNRSLTFPLALALSNGISLSATTGIADTDTGAVGAGDLSIDLDYK